MSHINVPRIYTRDEVRNIPIHARTAMRSAITGESKTPTRGAHGLEFSDFREYQPGDEIGRIDWNVTARLGKPWRRSGQLIRRQRRLQGILIETLLQR